MGTPAARQPLQQNARLVPLHVSFLHVLVCCELLLPGIRGFTGYICWLSLSIAHCFLLLLYIRIHCVLLMRPFVVTCEYASAAGAGNVLKARDGEIYSVEASISMISPRLLTSQRGVSSSLCVRVSSHLRDGCESIIICFRHLTRMWNLQI